MRSSARHIYNYLYDPYHVSNRVKSRSNSILIFVIYVSAGLGTQNGGQAAAEPADSSACMLTKITLHVHTYFYGSSQRKKEIHLPIPPAWMRQASAQYHVSNTQTATTENCKPDSYCRTGLDQPTAYRLTDRPAADDGLTGKLAATHGAPAYLSRNFYFWVDRTGIGVLRCGRDARREDKYLQHLPLVWLFSSPSPQSSFSSIPFNHRLQLFIPTHLI